MKVLMVDDHPLILAAMQNVVRGLGDHVRVTGVETTDEARHLLTGPHEFDLVLLDLVLGAFDGYDFLVELRATHPTLPVVVVSASERAADVIRCVDGGAMGFVPKRASNEMLFEALHLVMSGGIYVPPMARGLGGPHLPAVPEVQVFPGLPLQGSLSEAVEALAPEAEREAEPEEPSPVRAERALPHPGVQTGVPLGEPAGALPAGAPGRTSFDSLGLTPRQSEVLLLLLQGKANKVIARELGLSVETIKDHVAAVLRCLGVSSRTQAVLAVRHLQQPGSTGLRT
jgi:DNA-binding NarL/FixJ family response regulator